MEETMGSDAGRSDFETRAPRRPRTFVGCRRRARTTALLGCLVFAFQLALLPAAPARAEMGWVRGEVRLNLRTGPGTDRRIIGVVKTGDGLTILERGESWTKVRASDPNGGPDKEGWIPVGYLNPEPPPTIRLERAETRAAELAAELSELQESAEKLRSDNAILSSQDGEQQSKIKQLTMENMELRAGARYPEWIAGACIFAAGMILGAILHRNSARRQPTRIRL